MKGLIGLVNVLGTFIAIPVIDRFGRRKLLLASSAGMTASMATALISVLLTLERLFDLQVVL